MQAFLAEIANWITQLTDIEFWIGFTILTGMTAYSFWQMYTGFHYARLIENIPTARIRSAPQGYVELIGQARPMEGPIIVSPLSRTVCLWYRFKIEERVRQSNGKGGSTTRWRVVEQGVSDELFLIEDDTDQCVIDPENAQVITEYKKVWHKMNVIPPRRYTEELIRQGEPFYAMGLFTSVAQVEDQTIREQVSMLLREWKQDPNLLLHKYDANRDGHLSADEWQQARQDAHNTVKRNIGHQTKLKQLCMMQDSPHRDQPYILSTVPEHKLIQHYRTKAFVAMSGFLILGAVIVWATNVRMGW